MRLVAPGNPARALCEVRHNVGGEKLAGFDVVPVVAVDQKLDAGILVLTNQIDRL
jgi:hypothetical protein